ncbi:hypothetical protein ACFDTO_22520 [Microbacteriaceae bacterium 4G12]
MERKVTAYHVIFLILLVALLLVGNSLYTKLINEQMFLSRNKESVPVEKKSLDSTKQPKNFEVESKLESKKEEGGYVIETYREYEIYKDENGKVVETVPTANFNYLRYKMKKS